DTSVFPDGIEYDDANGEAKVHLHGLLDGDADLDGKVARDDFKALQEGFASPDPDWFGGDFNFDGLVNFRDYLTWKANVGDSVPGAVPEPGTLLLLAIGGLAMAGRRRK
ncbi:MAG: PEP-CTERM sorting domain-containing protein, partial [Phycisphaerae bacterium]